MWSQSRRVGLLSSLIEAAFSASQPSECARLWLPGLPVLSSCGDWFLCSNCWAGAVLWAHCSRWIIPLRCSSCSHHNCSDSSLQFGWLRSCSVLWSLLLSDHSSSLCSLSCCVALSRASCSFYSLLSSLSSRPIDLKCPMQLTIF